MPRHDGHTFRPRSRQRRAWLNARHLLDRSQKTSPLRTTGVSTDDHTGR